jgi:hypothetical protein
VSETAFSDSSLARLAAGLAPMPEVWVQARCPGLVEELGDGWRGELLALAARLRRRRG